MQTTTSVNQENDERKNIPYEKTRWNLLSNLRFKKGEWKLQKSLSFQNWTYPKNQTVIIFFSLLSVGKPTQVVKQLSLDKKAKKSHRDGLGGRPGEEVFRPVDTSQKILEAAASVRNHFQELDQLLNINN